MLNVQFCYNQRPRRDVGNICGGNSRRFSGAIMNKLIALLVLILAPALAVAEVQMTPQQQETANKLTAKGGLVIPLAADADSLVVSLNMAGKQATDADLAELKNLPKISQLNLANTSITDAGLANISNLTNLTHLHLEKTAITDAALPHL